MNCDQKVRYPNKRVAMDAARKARKRTGEAIFAYPCERHSGWHMGHVGDREFLRKMGRSRRGLRRQTA